MCVLKKTMSLKKRIFLILRQLVKIRSLSVGMIEMYIQNIIFHRDCTKFSSGAAYLCILYNSAAALYDVADQTQLVNDNFKLARRGGSNLTSRAPPPPIHPSEKCQNVMIRGEQVCVRD